MENLIKVAWFGSSFIGRSASGTAQTAKKSVVLLSKNFSHRVHVTLLLKSKFELEIAKSDPDLVNCELMLLDNKQRKFLSSSRQYYRYAWNNRKYHQFDIVHFSTARVYPFFYFFPAHKFVATFHAGGDITVPQDKFVLSRYIYNLIMKLQWKKLHSIIADSNFAVNEISEAYKIPTSRITKIYLGADNFWIDNRNIVKERTSKIAVIGRWQKYKNIHTVVDGISELNSIEKSEIKVVLVGKSDQLGSNLVNSSVKSFFGQIELFDYLPDQELISLYREVKIVIHPSINEGFGLPAFEAFSEGSVIIIHKNTPAAELLGSFEGVIIEDLTTKEGVKSAILNASKSHKIDISKRREYLQGIGATWANMAHSYLGVYNQLTSSDG
jgi:glycosyltransferase involved in cell wall biosynthesis